MSIDLDKRRQECTILESNLESLNAQVKTAQESLNSNRQEIATTMANHKVGDRVWNKSGEIEIISIIGRKPTLINKLEYEYDFRVVNKNGMTRKNRGGFYGGTDTIGKMALVPIGGLTGGCRRV